jgi:DNA-binding NtrC family response regulator
MNDDRNTAHSWRSLLTVIVAEKSPIARASLAALLIYDGYQVFQADRLDTALSHINNTHGSLVLLADVDMPGWKTIVQRTVKRTNALVIAMVGGGQPFSKICELKDRDIKVCLLKPIIYKDVRTAITGTMDISQNIALGSDQLPSEIDVETLRQ